jgi:hypothetical protein
VDHDNIVVLPLMIKLLLYHGLVLNIHILYTIILIYNIIEVESTRWIVTASKTRSLTIKENNTYLEDVERFLKILKYLNFS